MEAQEAKFDSWRSEMLRARDEALAEAEHKIEQVKAEWAERLTLSEQRHSEALAVVRRENEKAIQRLNQQIAALKDSLQQARAAAIDEAQKLRNEMAAAIAKKNEEIQRVHADYKRKKEG